MDKKQLYSYTGGNAQLFGVREVALSESKGKGMTLYEVSTSKGLKLDILADNGLDLGQLSFKGENISFMSSGGLTSSQRFVPYEKEFFHTFPGGMLYTCGMRNAGAACSENGEYHPYHGRYHSIPAKNHYGYIDEDIIHIGGTIRETELFGNILELKREISIPCNGSEITIHDTITNQKSQPTDIMMLYHINFGYPMLSEHTVLKLPDNTKTIPRDEISIKGEKDKFSFSAPIDNEPEQAFFHHCSPSIAILENPKLGIFGSVEWSGDNLPILAEWKCMASGDYALGLEPSNGYIKGRVAERANGTLKSIDGFGVLEYTVKLKFGSL